MKIQLILLLIFFGSYQLSIAMEICRSSFTKIAMKRPRHTAVIKGALEDPAAFYEEFYQMANTYNRGKPLVANNFPVVKFFAEDMKIILHEILEIENYFRVRGDMLQYEQLARKFYERGEALLKANLPYMDYITFAEYYTHLQDLKKAAALGRGVHDSQQLSKRENVIELYDSTQGLEKPVEGLLPGKVMGMQTVGDLDSITKLIQIYLNQKIFDIDPIQFERTGSKIKEKYGMPFYRLPTISKLNREEYSLLLSAPFDHEALPLDFQFQDNVMMSPSIQNWHDRHFHYGYREDKIKKAMPADYKATLEKRKKITQAIISRIQKVEDINLRLLLSVRLFEAIHERQAGSIELLLKPAADITPGRFNQTMSIKEKIQYQAIPEEEQKRLIMEAGELLRKWYIEIEASF